MKIKLIYGNKDLGKVLPQKCKLTRLTSAYKFGLGLGSTLSLHNGYLTVNDLYKNKCAEFTTVNIHNHLLCNTNDKKGLKNLY